MYYIYILRCSDNSLYTGITTDFEKRLATHMNKEKAAAKYTKSRSVVSAEALWTCEDKSGALKLECYIKRLTKKKKEELTVRLKTLEDIWDEYDVYDKNHE